MNFICIHGHFYQPPRENPSLEYVEQQGSAYPYHDWNERITAECYAPNAASRILDAGGHIASIVNNYAKISFNFGPTLLSWLQENAPETHRSIVEADRESLKTFSGHGSALAQAYNHMIMPLANSRDKKTQIIWGLRDFQCRFQRQPEAMWLPETAVDLETLDLLAECGMKFAILAPSQASRVRKLGSRSWKDVSGGRIDPTRAYVLRLPSRRKLAMFFYDGPISRAVAFEHLLDNGKTFAERLLSGFSDQRDWPQLVHIATDGESYGHHHHFGEMALSYALDYLQANQLAQLSIYGEFLENHPPTHQVEIFANSSWSCVHGVERWRANCGCNSGGHPEWNQQWRAPLREALDWLRDRVAPCYEEKARPLLKDAWQARNDYIEAILDRSPENVDRFLAQHATRDLQEAEKITVLKLLELQRHAMLMYTSCGWFFDELSGIETVQVIHYAGRVVQLARDLFSDDSVETTFLEKLSNAKSNLAEHRDGRHIYETMVRPSIVEIPRLAAHYAIRSVFEDLGNHSTIYSYEVDRQDYSHAEAGKMKLVTGRALFTSRITRESATLGFAVVHLGDHNSSAGVRGFPNDAEYRGVTESLGASFARGDAGELLLSLNQKFENHIYSLKSLFRDDQRRILDIILRSNLAEAEASVLRQYEQEAPLMRFLADLRLEQPKLFRVLAEFALNNQLREALQKENVETERVHGLLQEAATMKVPLDTATLEFVVRRQTELRARAFWENPRDSLALERLEAAVQLVRSLPFKVTLWQVQNLSAQQLDGTLKAMRAEADRGDGFAKDWVSRVTSLAENLDLRTMESPPQE
jgi:alpha-amylase/alpha-mannosidase (GH57 family)